ncbi:MAG: DUF1559 domain-containing protein, partial [Planctomycetota bacterium]
MKYAIKRPKDDDDDPPVRAARTQANRGNSQQNNKAVQVKPRVITDKPSIAKSTTPAAEAKADDNAAEAQSEPNKTSLEPQEALKRIAKAMLAYTEQKRAFPASAITDSTGQGMLSWRVELLPYLGYQELYDRIDRRTDWDSPRNEPLLKEIPAEYAALGSGTKTTILVPKGSSTAFPKGKRGLRTARIEDGPANTVIMVEVHEALAVPWMQPQEYDVNFQDPKYGLGRSDAGHFWVVWGDGRVGVIEKGISPIDAKAMFTVDAGEQFTFRKVNKSPLAIGPLAQRGPGQAAAVLPPSTPAASDTNVTAISSPSALTNGGGSFNSGGSFGTSGANGAAPTVPRLPVPDKASLTKSRATLREIYSQAFASAKTVPAKRALAQRLFDDAQGFDAGSADKYAMLAAAGKMAASAKALDVSFSVVDATSTEFDIDYYTSATGVLKRLGKVSPQEMAAGGVVERLNNLLQVALDRDDFRTFEKLYPSLKSAVGMRRDPVEMEALKELANRSKWLKREYLKVKQKLGSTNSNSDDNKSLFGAYYCFAKGDFKKGLPLLAQGSDLPLRAIAERDLAAPTAGPDQVIVGDGWWKLAEKEKATTPRANLQKRAAHWYQLALQQLPSGLDRVKAEMRYQTAMAGTIGATGSLPPTGLGGRTAGRGGV